MQKREGRRDPSFFWSGLLPVGAVVAFFLMAVLKLPFLQAIWGAVPFIVLFVVGPFWGRRSLRDFDQRAVSFLARNDHRGLRRLYDRAVGMRLFAPPAMAAERLGMVESEAGRHAHAIRAYRRALAGYENEASAPTSVTLGFAHAAFELKRYPEASEMYRRLLPSSRALPLVKRNLAESLIHQEEAIREGLGLLEEALRERPSDEERGQLELLQALGLARIGEKKNARKLLRDSSLDSEWAEELREHIEEAL
ncbi:MAG: hypothetical protein AAGF12_24195 [Myxococcota bacterium]